MTARQENKHGNSYFSQLLTTKSTCRSTMRAERSICSGFMCCAQVQNLDT